MRLVLLSCTVRTREFMIKKYWSIIGGFIAICIFVSSCKKDAATSWDTEMLVPIATSNLTLQNLVKDSAVKTNPDQSLTLAYNQALYSFNLADQVVNIPDTSLSQKFTLDSLSLPNVIIAYNLTMGMLAQSLANNSNPFLQAAGNDIINNDGQSMVIPAIPGYSSDIFTFDGSAFFQQATLSRGQVRIYVNNYFPVPITNVILEVRNNSNNTLIAADTIPYIGVQDSVYRVLDISGKTIESSMKLNLVNFSTPGSSPNAVPIHLSDYIKLYIEVANMRASDAIARFPSQDILRSTQEITQQIGERKLTYVDAREGQLHVFMTSSIQQPLQITYILEGAYDKAGRPLTAVTDIPAALPGQTVTIDRIYDVAGYSINLTGKDGNKFNTYTQTIIAHTDSTGELAHITLADSLQISYVIENITPNYIKGYLGRDTISQADTAGFAFLDMFKSGTIDLQDVNMKFSILNGLGVDGEVRINSLKATSPVNGTRTLTGNILGQPLVINRATDFPLTPALNEFTINNSNSNIKDLLGILPTQLQYDVAVKTNLNGNNGQYRDFAYLESALKINLNAEIPLSFIASHLMLRDTFDFNLSNTNLNVAGISDGVLNLIANNKYPIEAVLTMIMYDETWAPVDTFLIDTRVLPGDLDNNCRVNAFKKTKIPLYIDEDRMENVKRARRAVITADFSTSSNNTLCNGQHLKVYSDYALDLTFTARFNYKINTRF